MPSLIKRSNLRYLSNNIESLYHAIVLLLNRINIPIKFSKCINKYDKIINNNKYLYYRITYYTLKTIEKYLQIHISKLNKNNYTINLISIYFDYNYKNSYTKFNIIKIN